MVILFIGLLFLFRNKKNKYNADSFLGGRESMMTSMILGYLLSHALINRNQFDSWRYLDYNNLHNTLINEKIVTEDEFVEINSQAESDYNKQASNMFFENDTFDGEHEINDYDSDFGDFDSDSFD